MFDQIGSIHGTRMLMQKSYVVNIDVVFLTLIQSKVRN